MLRNNKGDDYLQLNDIVNHCRMGDLECFEELYKLYYNKAYGTAYIISGQKNIAEDIVQEAFIICYRSIKHIKNPQTFNTWFYRIVVRASWRITKKQKNSYVESFSANLDCGDPVKSNEYNPFDLITGKLLIRQKIQTLKLPLKTVLILYYYNDMSVKEISKVLDCFEGTVKSRLFKARKILKKELSSYYEDVGKSLDLMEGEA